jgi:hypothetical protein
LTCQPNGASDVWAGAWSSGTTYTNKQTVSYTDTTSAYYVATSAAGNLNKPPRAGGVVNTTYWTQQEAYCAYYYWNVPTTLVQPSTAWAAVGGHAVGGYLNQYFGSSYASGSISNPSAQLSPPNGPITLNPGTNLLPTSLPSDDHPSYNNTGTSDLQPVFSALDDVPAWVTRYQVSNGACYDEVCAFANVTTGATAKTYRFAHVYNTNNMLFFSNQDNIGSVSPLGDLFIVGTDMMGTRGDRRGSYGSTQSQNLRGMFSPSSVTSLSLGDTLYPSSSNAGNYIYQATVAGSTNGGAPSGGWCQTVGCTASWTTASPATVQNVGANTNRGDVMIVDLTSAHAATGNVINAASCSSGNILSAIASASNGDTVAVPAGNCTWNTPSSNTPVIALTKAITLQGTTTCAGSPVTCVDGTIINDNTGNGFDENLIDDNADNSRITGFSFKDPRNLNDAKPPVQLTCNNCRFDHNSMTQSNTGGAPHGIYVFSSPTSAQRVDHNYFKDLNGAADVDGSGADTHYPGDVSWATSLTLGSGNAAYIEDNNFDFTAGTVLDGAYDSYAGARLVFRFNTVNSTNFGGHGLDSGGLRSTLLQEVYGNTVTNLGSHVYTMMGTRGGTHMIFNNTVSASGGSYDSFIWLQNYRGDPGCGGECGSFAVCTGSNIIDQDSSGNHGWLCRDQVGRGPETAPSGDWPANTSNPTYSEASYPGYEWGNTFKGAAPTTANINICGYPCSGDTNVATYQVLNNRDFYMEDATHCVPVGACTQGTATGTWANRPTSCTPGTGYWATDLGNWNQSGSGGQGKFYTCTASNTWTPYYTPYTYPHPLQ